MNILKSLKFIYLCLRCAILSIIVGTRSLYYDYTMKKSNRVTLRSLPGKVAVITGGNRGIGREVTKMLLNCDMTVVLGCKQEEKQLFLEEISQKILQFDKLIVFDLDVSSLRSVKEFATEIKTKYSKINFLINNAGISCSSKPFSEEGNEMVFATNHLGHFYLTHLLLPLLKKGAECGGKSRIVNTSSSAYSVGHINFEDIHRRNMYVQPEVYAQSKLALTLFSNYLCTIMKETKTNVDVHSVDPGLVNTEIYRGTFGDYVCFSLFTRLFFKTPIEGAKVVLYACLEDDLEAKSGEIIINCKVRQQIGTAIDPVLQENLFQLSKNLINVSDYGTRRNLGTAFIEEISKEGAKTERLLIYELDTSSLESVKLFASTVVKKFEDIHYLINNAGISNSTTRYTKDGFDVVFATNYLGHFYLTHLLLPLLKNGGSEINYSRVVNITSCTYAVGNIHFSDINRRELYFPPDVYAQSKLALTLFSNYLNKLLVEEISCVQSFAVDPGCVNTEIFKGTLMHSLLWWYVDLLFKKVEEGAVSIVYACIGEQLEGNGGSLILNGKIVEQTEMAKNTELQRKLYDFSKNLIVK